MDYKTIIDCVLVIITIFEQFLSYLPSGYPHSTVQLFVYIIVLLVSLFKRKKHKEIVVLTEIK